MILEKERTVFIHIPKTGGTSISNALGYSNDLRSKHCSVVGYIERMNRLAYHRFFKFTVVRNPYDRIVSYFEWKRFNIIEGTYNKHITDEEMDMVMDKGFSNWFIKFVTNYRDKPFKTRYKTGPNNQTLMLINRKNVISIDSICRFETLERDFLEVAKKQELEIKVDKFPHSLKTDRKPYQEYYSNNAREIASRYYSQDLKNFNYCF